MRILLFFGCLFLLNNCGSRNVQKEKSFQHNKEQVKTAENSEKETQTSVNLQSDTEVKKMEISQEKTAENKNNIQNTESNSQKTKSENNSKTIKRTEYYQNGKKKSEMEMSENFSKVSDEKEYYKSRSEQLEEKLKISVKIQDSIYKQNLGYYQKNKELIKINKESLSLAESTNEQLKRVSDRKGLSFGAVVWIVIISLVAGAIIWEVIKSYLPKWRLNLFNIK